MLLFYMQDALLIRGDSTSGKIIHSSLPVINKLSIWYYEWINGACMFADATFLTVIKNINCSVTINILT